jgi:leucyl/phenylalanyl-tRNA---protein transferase
MTIWLSPNDMYFPHPESADSEGIIAIGGDLSPKRLLLAYSMGIFPWYNDEEPILWWSPDPRMVLFPNDLKIAKSMRPYFNQEKFKVTYNIDFQQVMKNCMQANREGQYGTWINLDMINAYTQLHRLGYAHSVEVWQEGDLVGGLYGIAIGRVFFGESMFTKVSNASKFGFISLVKKLKDLGFWLIDCQQETRHLGSLGARPIPRADFCDILFKNENEPQILKITPLN